MRKFRPLRVTTATLTSSATLVGVGNHAGHYKRGTNEYIYAVDGGTGSSKTIKRVDLATGTVTTNAYGTTSSGYYGVAVDASTGTLYVSEGSQIGAFTFDSTTSTPPTVIAGTNTGTTAGFVDGAGASALFNNPGQLSYFKDGTQGNP